MERWTQEPIKEILDQIDKDDHQERIVYLEEHAYLLGTLDDYDRNYCTYHYIHSLHAVERYDEVLTMIDEVIEYVFLYNMEFIPSRTYEHLLYIKTEAYYHTLQYESALEVGKQLLGMHPRDRRYRKMVEHSYRSYFSFKSTTIKLIALILIFSSSFVSAIIWYASHHGQEESMTMAFSIIIAPTMLALFLLGCSHLYNYIMSIKKTDELIEQKVKERNL